MNTGHCWMKVRRYILLPPVVALLTSCTAYMGDHKVIVEDYSRPIMQPKKSGFPDPVLPFDHFEARLPSGIHICFPDFEEC